MLDKSSKLFVTITNLSSGNAVLFKVFSDLFFRFKNQQKDLSFDVHVIHSLAMRMSVIHVYHDNKLLVVSHLIGPEQMPSPKQVWMLNWEKSNNTGDTDRNAFGRIVRYLGRWSGLGPVQGQVVRYHCLNSSLVVHWHFQT